MLKRISVFISVLLIAYCITSCNKSADSVKFQPLRQDTLDVISLAIKYLDLLENRQYDDAVKMIHGDSAFFDSTNLCKIERLKRQYSFFPIDYYKIYFIDFRSEECTLLNYAIKSKEGKDSDVGMKIKGTIKLRHEDNFWKIADALYSGE